MVGRHVIVWGHSSSGKTTVARQIARRIGAPHIELDAVFWQPDWAEKPVEEFRADVYTLLEKHAEGWVFDGNYGRIKDLVLPQADTVVWIRLPFRVVFWRVLKRTISRILSREPLWDNNYETWRKSFFSRESLLLYVIKNWRRHVRKGEKELATIPHNAEIIMLRSSRAVDEFLAGLDAEI
jgi:adenylate kinase family enzyme